jgi:hypothetical protein
MTPAWTSKPDHPLRHQPRQLPILHRIPYPLRQTPLTGRTALPPSEDPATHQRHTEEFFDVY